METQRILLGHTAPVDIGHTDEVTEGRVHADVRDTHDIVQPLLQSFALGHTLIRTLHSQQHGLVRILVHCLGRERVHQQRGVAAEERFTERLEITVTATDFHLERVQGHEVGGVGTHAVAFLERIGDLCL